MPVIPSTQNYQDSGIINGRHYEMQHDYRNKDSPDTETACRSRQYEGFVELESLLWSWNKAMLIRGMHLYLFTRLCARSTILYIQSSHSGRYLDHGTQEEGKR